MGQLLIHQALHGYRKGHERLASSINLGTDAGDLIARLSDLSGPLLNSEDFGPYITAYPLPGLKYYAVAKTWLDKDASRAGCVYTHTLLVPEDAWRTMTAPHRLTALFRFPEGADFKLYGLALSIDDCLPAETLAPISDPRFVLFLSKYFGDGRRPLIWFNAVDGESILWHILGSLWPELRLTFACCSFALQARSLDQSPFDLLFSPGKYYPRFQKIPRENVIESLKQPESTKLDPWWDEWVGAFRSGHPWGVFGSDVSPLLSALGTDPTEVRRLFLLRELNERSLQFPAAAVGTLDLVSALAPTAGVALDFKESMIRRAIGVAVEAKDTIEGFRYLQLIDDRLVRSSFQGVRARVAAKLSESVAGLAEGNMDAALQVLSPVQESQLLTNTAFLNGLILGILAAVERDPIRLSRVRQLAFLGSHLLAQNPALAVTYFESAPLESPQRSEAASAIGEWFSGCDRHSQSSVRHCLLGSIAVCTEQRLLDHILQDLSENEVYSVLDRLLNTSDGFTIRQICESTTRTICKSHPKDVFRWASKQQLWSTGISDIASACFSDDLQGLEAAISIGLPDPVKQSQLVASKLTAIMTPYAPPWLAETLSHDHRPLRDLIGAELAIPDEALAVLQSISSLCDSLPITLVGNSFNAIQRIGNHKLRSRLTAMAIDNAVSRTIECEHLPDDARIWLSSPYYSEWASLVEGHRLQRLIARHAGHSPFNWLGVWRWLEGAPKELLGRRPAVLPQLVDHMIRSTQGQWTDEVVGLWLSVLDRASRESPPETHFELSVHALESSFRNRDRPLGKVVALAFLPVYRAAITSSDSSNKIYALFAFWNWDAGKLLRNELVDSFVRSAWLPGDLAIATGGGELLRKILKRVIRHPNGGQTYADSMLRDLENRSDPSVRVFCVELRQLLSNPEYREDWD